ncbi:SDR family oxidoreductase [Prevotella sp.]|uniref:SDR family oxidoreductase n=1 Tax=Prevotella sp. TaxID=59823 RepID=UPI003AB3D9E5
MNRVVVVTGGAGGIGRCIVEHFAVKGDVVYFIDNNGEELNEMVSRMSASRLNVTGFLGDIASEQTLRDFAAFVISRHPEGIHCLINNACITKKGALSGCSYDDFLYVMRVGVVAPYMLSLLFKDHFCGLGSIVNLSSTRAFQSQADTESYSAAKGGITSLTHALAVSLAGVARVNSIAPGWIDTGAYHHGGENYVPSYSAGDIKQHPSCRVGEPADIARVVDFLCDERNSFINGENVTVDGGMSRLMIYHDDYGWKLE